MRGPAPTPTSILASRGSWRAKTRPNEPKPVTAVPEPPKGLSGEALKEWNRQSVEMMAAGTVCRMDRAVFVIWCETWSDFVRLRKLVKSKESTGKGVAWAYKDARDTLIKLAGQFGFTPAARARLHAEPPKSEEEDPLEKLLGPSKN